MRGFLDKEQFSRITELKESGMQVAEAARSLGVEPQHYYDYVSRKRRIEDPNYSKKPKSKTSIKNPQTFSVPVVEKNITISGSPIDIGEFIATIARGIQR
jgi:hypothetical protein